MPVKFRPLIPIKLTDPRRLRYPLYISPKIDGVRCSFHPTLSPITRNINRIGNPHVRQALSDQRLHGFDGELTVGYPVGPEVVSRTIDAIVSGRRPIDFHFFVFDDFSEPERPFKERLAKLNRRIGALDIPWLHAVPHGLIKDHKALIRLYDKFLGEGFEGAVLRARDARYREGRPPASSLIAVKLKPSEPMQGRRAFRRF